MRALLPCRFEHHTPPLPISSLLPCGPQVVSEEGLNAWREDDDESVANKTKALFQLNQFFTWLQTAAEEDDDDDEQED